MFVSGFPQDVNPQNRVYTSKGHGTNNSTNDLMAYSNHVYNGLSGSPVYTATKYKIGDNDWTTIYTAISIHESHIPTESYGPTMNEKLLTFFMQGSTNVGY